MRKFLVGRAVCDDLVQLAVENWAGEFLRHCQDDNERQIVAGVIVQNVKRCHQLVSSKSTQEYGMWWVLILQGVASAIVQLIVRWWLERRANRVMMAVWKEELTR